MPTVTVDDIEVNYALSGPKGAPVVTFSHSLSANLAMWNPQAAHLEAEYRVLRYDTRGHGGTSAPKGAYTLSQLANDAVGLLRALDIERTHFVGLSMGGMIGQTLALEHPEVLQTLTLADTSSGYDDSAAANWQARIDMAEREGMAGMVSQMARTMDSLLDCRANGC